MIDWLKSNRSDYAKQVEKVGQEQIIERDHQRQEKFREAQALKAREAQEE